MLVGFTKFFLLTEALFSYISPIFSLGQQGSRVQQQAAKNLWHLSSLDSDLAYKIHIQRLAVDFSVAFGVLDAVIWLVGR